MDLRLISMYLNTFAEAQGRLSVLFVVKQGIKYQGYLPQISNEVQQSVIKLLHENLAEIIQKDLTEIPFNPSGQQPEEYSVCENSYVGNFEEVIGLFDTGIDHEEVKASQISYLIFRLRVNNDNEDTKYIYLFRKNSKLKNLRKGFWINKIADVYNKLGESEIIGIDGMIDCIAFEDQIAFFSHISAERFFNLREQFYQNAQEVLDTVREGTKIQNFEIFKEDCLNDARITRRLTKIHSNPAIIELFHSHFDNAPEVVKEFDLNITFNADKSQIIYTDKEELKDITLLMRDAYYRTVLANRKGIDDFN